MTPLFVDTSVWSLAWRRDAGNSAPEVSLLAAALEGGRPIVTTGLVLQELLRGFNGPKARGQILEKFAALPLLTPARQDHIDAATLRNECRRRGVQIGTIDALISQLCVRHGLTLLTADRGFERIARVRPLKLARSRN